MLRLRASRLRAELTAPPPSPPALARSWTRRSAGQLKHWSVCRTQFSYFKQVPGRRERDILQGSQQRARQLVDERNWLIHRCRSDHRHAVRPGRSADALLERLDRIHELALPVYHTIGEAVRQYVLAHGVDPLEIDREFLRDLFGDER